MNFVINRLGFDSKVSYVLKSFIRFSCYEVWFVEIDYVYELKNLQF